MHPYLHDYYSAAKFKDAYASPIPALTDQSQWPEVNFDFSLCPPLTRRKVGWPKVNRFKAWFEKVEVARKERKRKRKMESLKGNKKEIKIDVSVVKNLATELDQPNVVIPFQSLKSFSISS
jgi:hypothetical protein